jgi:hypothetical protein
MISLYPSSSATTECHRNLVFVAVLLLRFFRNTNHLKHGGKRACTQRRCAEHVHNGDVQTMCTTAMCTGTKVSLHVSWSLKTEMVRKLFVKFYNTELTRMQSAVLGLLHAHRMKKETVLIDASKGCECS